MQTDTTYNTDKKIRSLAKAKGFDFSCERVPHLTGHFEYEDGSCQGMTYFIDVAFIYRFCRVFGVYRLQQVNDKSCWVTHDNNDIYLIEPLHKKDGKSLNVNKWRDWLKSISLYTTINVDQIEKGF